MLIPNRRNRAYRHHLASIDAARPRRSHLRAVTPDASRNLARQRRRLRVVRLVAAGLAAVAVLGGMATIAPTRTDRDAAPAPDDVPIDHTAITTSAAPTTERTLRESRNDRSPRLTPTTTPVRTSAPTTSRTSGRTSETTTTDRHDVERSSRTSSSTTASTITTTTSDDTSKRGGPPINIDVPSWVRGRGRG